MTTANELETESLQITAWNMNGGAIPRKTVKRLEGAVASILKDAPNARIVHNIVRTDTTMHVPTGEPDGS